MPRSKNIPSLFIRMPASLRDPARAECGFPRGDIAVFDEEEFTDRINRNDV